MSSTDIQKPYADKAMFQAAPMQSTTPKVHLLWMTPDPLGAIAAACRMYEGKPTYSLSDITDDERRHYWEQANATHLKAPLEFVTFHFFIEGVDRAFTHQMVRQRTAVYAQESMRFAVKDNLAAEASLPPSLFRTEGGQPMGAEDNVSEWQRNIWDAALREIEETYNHLVDSGMPAEEARGLLPHATLTRLNYATNLRALAEHAGNRLCTQAQFAWRIFWMENVKAIAEYGGEFPGYVRGAEHPNAWQYRAIAQMFRPVCYSHGKCPFKASFDRGCTIRERADRGAFDEIDPREYLLDPKAAFVYEEEK